jgi:hypothetical protein
MRKTGNALLNAVGLYDEEQCFPELTGAETAGKPKFWRRSRGGKVLISIGSDIYAVHVVLGKLSVSWDAADENERGADSG